MCNACGFLCCGSDLFSRCGCNGCDEFDCWDDDAEDDDEIEYLDDDDIVALPISHRAHCCAVLSQ